MTAPAVAEPPTLDCQYCDETSCGFHRALAAMPGAPPLPTLDYRSVVPGEATPAVEIPDWEKRIRHDVFFTQYRFGEAMKKLAAGDAKGAAADLGILADGCAKIEAACRVAAKSLTTTSGGAAEL